LNDTVTLAGSNAGQMSTSGLKFDTIIFLSGVDFMRFAKMSGNFWLYFYCACTETAIHELSVNILTPAFNSSTPVFCLRKAIFRRLEDILVYISTNKMVAGLEKEKYNNIIPLLLCR